MQMLDVSTEFSNDPEILELMRMVGDRMIILNASQSDVSPCMILPLSEVQRLLTSRIASVMDIDPDLDDSLRRLELRGQGNGTTVDWRTLE